MQHILMYVNKCCNTAPLPKLCVILNDILASLFSAVIDDDGVHLLLLDLPSGTIYLNVCMLLDFQ